MLSGDCPCPSFLWFLGGQIGAPPPRKKLKPFPPPPPRPRLPRVVCESRACRGAAVPVVAGQERECRPWELAQMAAGDVPWHPLLSLKHSVTKDSPAWLWLDGNGLVRQLNDALRMIPQGPPFKGSRFLL